MGSLVERYEAKIRGVLSCYDRVVIQGTLPGLCYAGGMTAYLHSRGIRIFDYPRFAEPFRDAIRSNAERVAKEAGVEIDFIRKLKAVRKEDLVREKLKKRGEGPGLVAVLSAMEACESYQPWYDKKTGKTFLRPDSGKCLHYYFYFVDEALGLCYLRVPTWCPFKLQFYFNGHNWLAAKLREKGYGYELVDNAIVRVDDFAKAQEVADALDVKPLHQGLDRFVERYCPAAAELKTAYHWSIMQAEYATDIVFTGKEALQTTYEALSRVAIQAVKADHVATFLGHKIHERYEGEVGSDLTTRLEGMRIKHFMGPASIKMYDKFGVVLRIETTINDVGFFKHYRKVEQRDGQTVFKLAPVKKTIYSLQPDLRELMGAANRRYLEFISELGDPTAGTKALTKVTEPAEENGRNYKGLNFFDAGDQELLETIARGEFVMGGLRNSDLRGHLKKTPGQISRLLKRLRTHGLMKKMGRTYKYYLTDLGRRVVLAGLKLKEFVLIPALCEPAMP